MTDDLTIRAELRDTAAWLAKLTLRVGELTKRRDELIHEALAAGMRPVDVAADAGVHRSRVDQIKRGR